MAEPLFDLLLRQCSEARRELALIAPFMKESVVRRLIEAVPPKVSVWVVTRWRLDEIVAGVSDLDVWAVVSSRRRSCGDASMLLHSDLHAKLYRSDDRVLIGSANLTAAGLGLASPNVELLVRTSEDQTQVQEVEEQLRSEGVVVDDLLYSHYRDVVSSIRPVGQPLRYDDVGGPWLPRFRQPERIADAVADTHYPNASRQAALSDLAALGVPAGAVGHDLVGAVSLAFANTLVVRRLRPWARNRRRFGELRRWVAEFSPSVSDYTVQAQTLYRWLAVFLADEFTLERGRYSETIRLRDRLAVGLHEQDGSRG